MSDDSNQSTGATTSVSRVINAPRQRIYQSFMSGEAVASWLAPDGMRSTVHQFEPREGGEIRMSLTYLNVEESPDGKGGKSTADTDTFRGTFVELIPDEKVVWRTEFESSDPAFADAMTLIWSFVDADGGTEVTVRCENIPRGVRPEDNEEGSRSTLEKLAAFLECVCKLDRGVKLEE
jgi:uncharacterized protein YndB with AHSA1/START domain